MSHLHTARSRFDCAVIGDLYEHIQPKRARIGVGGACDFPPIFPGKRRNARQIGVIFLGAKLYIDIGKLVQISNGAIVGSLPCLYGVTW